MSDLPTLLVIMALPVESQGVFEQEGVPVLFTGVGKINAAWALTRKLNEYRHSNQSMPLVINLEPLAPPTWKITRLPDEPPVTISVCAQADRARLPLRGALTLDTRYLVLGAVPADKAGGDAYKKMLQEATDLGKQKGYPLFFTTEPET